MRRRKLYAAVMAATLAVGMMGTTAMAATATGDSEVTYTAGTSGPTDPVDPGTEETNPNNWMVVYPKAVTLTDNNIGKDTDFATIGQKLKFKVKQRVPGIDGSDKVTEENVQGGIDVKAMDASTTWTDSSQDITLQGDQSAGTATMHLGKFDNSVVTKGESLGKLNHTTDTNNGSAIILDTSKTVDGASYKTTLTFNFEQATK